MMINHKGIKNSQHCNLDEEPNHESKNQNNSTRNCEEHIELSQIDFTQLSLPELKNMLRLIDLNQVKYEKEAEALINRQKDELKNLRNTYLEKQAEILELMKSTTNTSELSQYNSLYNDCSTYLINLSDQEQKINQQCSKSVNMLNFEWDQYRKIVEKLISGRK